MRSTLVAALARRGVLSRREALRLVPEHVLDDALADGVVARIMPGVYGLAGRGGDRDLLRRAALRWRPDGALSHVDALDVWGLPAHLGRRLHVTVGGASSASTWPTVHLHRRRSFDPTTGALPRRGLRVVPLEQAVVESWPLLPPVDRRVPAIVALRERRTTAERLRVAIERNTRASGRAELRHVVALPAAGCHSPLEMWGHEHVFSDARLPRARCQAPMTIGTGQIYLDRLYDEELVDVELDGAAYHAERGQRERDLRRDAELASRGILTVRFSHPRLHGDPAGVIEQLLAILATRRRQLGHSAA